MRILWMASALVIVGVLGTLTAGTSHATIHEIVAAYCSGGGVGAIEDNGFLEPPGIDDPTQGNFAQPVVASGATTDPDAGGIISISDKPNTKFPEGTQVVDVDPLPPTSLLDVSESDHPSAQHCPKAADLP